VSFKPSARPAQWPYARPINEKKHWIFIPKCSI